MTLTKPLHLSSMSQKAYAKLAARLEKRFSPDLPWEKLPLLRAGQRGRPRSGAPHLSLTPRTVKMPDPIWKGLAEAADEEGVSVNALLSALNGDLLRRHLLEREIRRLIRAGLLMSHKDHTGRSSVTVYSRPPGRGMVGARRHAGHESSCWVADHAADAALASCVVGRCRMLSYATTRCSFWRSTYH